MSYLILAQWRNMVAAAYCVKTLYFSICENSPNLTCCNFFKVDIIVFKNPLQKLRIFIFWLFLGGGGGGGGRFDEKIQKNPSF